MHTTPLGGSWREVPSLQRTQRACDECRRRKTKCDGILPCSACIPPALNCSYGSKTKGLEARSIEDFGAPSESDGASDRIRDNQSSYGSPATSSSSIFDITLSEKGMIMMKTSWLDRLVEPKEHICPPCESLSTLSELEFLETSDSTSGGASFLNPRRCAYGSWGGIVVLRQIRLRLDDVAGVLPDQSLAFLFIDALDRPHPQQTFLSDNPPNIFCPRKESLMRVVDLAFHRILRFWPFVDRANIYSLIVQVYSPAAIVCSGSDHHHDQMALLYAVASLSEIRGTPYSLSAGSWTGEASWTGLRYFQAAQRIVDPADCRRSIVAVQAVTCMIIYLVLHSSITAARILISNAAAAALHLGLHQDPDALVASEAETYQRRRIYQSLRTLDAYISQYLGLPALLPVASTAIEHIQGSERCQRTHHNPGRKEQANNQLLTILTITQQRAYFSGMNVIVGGAHRVPASILRESGQKFDAWTRSHHEYMSKFRANPPLLGQFANPYAQMMTFSPYFHYVLNTPDQQTHDGYMAGFRCVVAAIHYVCVMEQQHAKNELLQSDVHHFSSFGLIFAATVLLLVELAGATPCAIGEVRLANTFARKLLQRLSSHNRVVFSCLESLQPLYQLATDVRDLGLYQSAFDNIA